MSYQKPTVTRGSASRTETTRKGPNSPLLKGPCFSVRLIEAKDIYSDPNCGEAAIADAYATLSYLGSQTFKTEVVSKTSNPKWNERFEFELQDTSPEHDILVLSIYDSDPLGSDELLANQLIPMTYFRRSSIKGQEETLWIELNSLASQDDQDERILVDTSVNILSELQCPHFKSSIIQKDHRKFLDISTPKIQLTLKLTDHEAIFDLNCEIVQAKQLADSDGLKLHYYTYLLSIKRNDGLQWFVSRRYSDIYRLRKHLKEDYPAQIKALPFPVKNMLKFTSYFSTTKQKEFHTNSLERKAMLNSFLSQLVRIKDIHANSAFIEFFSSC